MNLPPDFVPVTLTSPSRGLSHEEVDARKKAGLQNGAVQPQEKSTAAVILTNFFTYFNLLFFFLALCLLFTGSGVKNLLFLGVVLCNTVITTVQELRSKKLLSSLSLLHAPRVKVVREGVVAELGAEQLVRDDVILLSAGNQIPADAVVVEGTVQVNESLVTGEADEVAKTVSSPLLSGSFVLSGTCRARLTQVGSESFVSRLTLEAKKQKRISRPGMMRALSLLVRVIGVLILPLGALLLWQQLTARATPLTEAMQSTVTALIGMIPEGLYLLVSAALALAVFRLARRGILAHTLGCVETLARVDVLCLDKTGTITENEMSFSALYPVGDAPFDEEAAKRALTRFCAASDTDNATVAALQSAFSDGKREEPVSVIGFSSKKKFSAVAFSDAAFVLGAPDVLDPSLSDTEEFRTHTLNGERMLLFCTCASLKNGSFEGELVPLCFVALSSRVRESARKTFSYFTEQGVEIKVISGDHPQATSVVALAAGIEGAERYVDATTLKTTREIRRAARDYTVFGRVTPEQKRELIRALRHDGHTVCMTGDGVNDVLALKEADCSVAMASGSDVAAHVSQIVLLESDFSAMPSVVAEGRQVINNIQRSAALYLVKNVFSFCLAFLLLFANLSYSVRPIQLTLVSTLTIGVPSFFLALEKNRERVCGGFLANVLSRALPAGLTDFILLSAVMLAERFFPTLLPAPLCATVMILLLSFVGFLMLFSLSRPFNFFRTLLFSALLAALLIALFLFAPLFDLVALTPFAWGLFGVSAAVGLGLFCLFTAVQKKVSSFLFTRKEKKQKKSEA
ncbi:MAG: HAD-IC family P-type ATPase [Clostridia bacterium]|nr:HAD-IC family P-type ATPase [Clostridia bacterium]